MLSSIQNLREITRLCHAGEPLDQDLSRWLGNSLQDFLDHRCRSIDDALGLRFPQGGIPWWREEAIRARDAALRQLVARYFAALNTSARAREVFRLSIRYAGSAWRYDREREMMPHHYAGTGHEYLWRAFQSGAAMPIGERQLRTILAD